MKKKVTIGICVLLMILMLIPLPLVTTDGGSVSYAAVLYTVENVHQLNNTGSGQEYLEGTIVRILGIEVFNNVK